MLWLTWSPQGTLPDVPRASDYAVLLYNAVRPILSCDCWDMVAELVSNGRSQAVT